MPSCCALWAICSVPDHNGPRRSVIDPLIVIGPFHRDQANQAKGKEVDQAKQVASKTLPDGYVLTIKSVDHLDPHDLLANGFAGDTLDNNEVTEQQEEVLSRRHRKQTRMPRYDIVVTLNPPSLFGLPDEGWLVFDSESPILQSVAIDPRTQNVVGHGTLSRYRDYDDRLLANLPLNTLQLEIEDNFVRLSLDASDPETALHAMTQEMTRFCAVAYILIGEFLTFDMVQIMEDRVAVKFGENRPLMHGMPYNLGRLKGKLTEASSLLDGLPPDPTLNQALRYYADGGTLIGLVTEHRLRRLLAPLCFLQFWKALATIVGDPSSDTDHQSRYRKFGIGEGDKNYFNRVLKPLHTVRNRFDVAHVASLQEPVFVGLWDVARCRSEAKDAIQAYITHLRQTSGHDVD